MSKVRIKIKYRNQAKALVKVVEDHFQYRDWVFNQMKNSGTKQESWVLWEDSLMRAFLRELGLKLTRALLDPNKKTISLSLSLHDGILFRKLLLEYNKGLGDAYAGMVVVQLLQSVDRQIVELEDTLSYAQS